jgi:hypothetical protein
MNKIQPSTFPGKKIQKNITQKKQNRGKHEDHPMFIITRFIYYSADIFPGMDAEEVLKPIHPTIQKKS